MKNKEKEVKVNVINKVHDVIDGNIIQTIKNGDKIELLIFNESEVIAVSEYEINNKILKLVDTIFLEQDIISVPSSISSNGIERLHIDIFNFIKINNVVTDEVAMLMTSYAMYTWLQDKFSTAPYLWFVGGFGTGKSRLGSIMKLLCFNSTNLGTSVTDANIFRLQEISRGTLIMDEMNMDYSNKDSALAKILNGGYSKDTGIVFRSEKRAGKQFAPTPHNSFGAKVIISINEPKDGAIKSRCFVVHTEKIDSQVMIEMNIPFEITPYMRKQAENLRNRLFFYRCINYNNTPKNRNLNYSKLLTPRAHQIVETVVGALPEIMVSGSRSVLEKHLFEEGVSQAVQEETYISVALNELTVNNREYPINIPYVDISNKIFELFNIMYDSKDIGKMLKQGKYETKRLGHGYVVVLRNVDNVDDVGDREDKE